MNENGDHMDIPTSCVASAKTTGTRCRNSPIIGGHVCRMHGGAAPQVKRKAAERIAKTRDSAIDALNRLIDDGLVDARVALDAVVKLTETHETLEGRVARREGRVVDERSNLDTDIRHLLDEFETADARPGSNGKAGI